MTTDIHHILHTPGGRGGGGGAYVGNITRDENNKPPLSDKHIGVLVNLVKSKVSKTDGVLGERRDTKEQG